MKMICLTCKRSIISKSRRNKCKECGMNTMVEYGSDMYKYVEALLKTQEELSTKIKNLYEIELRLLSNSK